MNTSAHAGHTVILFDGVCNLCNAVVNFVIDHDPAGHFTFGALQSEEGRALLHRYDQPSDVVQSVVLIEDGQAYVRSTAALRITRQLSGVWPLLYAFILVPRPLRDAVYEWVTHRRYRWFGKRDHCRVPTPELQARFLSGNGGVGERESG